MKVNLLNRAEHIVAKDEIAHDEQFFLLPQCFQKASDAMASEIFYYVGKALCVFLSPLSVIIKPMSRCFSATPFPHATNLQQMTLKTFLQKVC